MDGQYCAAVSVAAGVAILIALPLFAPYLGLQRATLQVFAHVEITVAAAHQPLVGRAGEEVDAQRLNVDDSGRISTATSYTLPRTHRTIFTSACGEAW